MWEIEELALQLGGRAAKNESTSAQTQKRGRNRGRRENGGEEVRANERQAGSVGISNQASRHQLNDGIG